MKTRLLIILIYFFPYNVLFGQGIIFDHFGTLQGLSHNSVISIDQDNMGNIWFGTRNGLNKFDGNSITQYLTDPYNPETLHENQIKQLKVCGNNLWIQTYSGLSCYDLNKETFRNFHISGISAFYPTTNFVWVGCGGELYKFFSEENNLQKVNFNLGNNPAIHAIIPFGENLVLGTKSGVWLYSPQGKERELVANIFVTRLFVDSHNRIWAGSYRDGAYCIDSSGEVTKYMEGKISSNFVRCIEEDSDGNIWLGTMRGLDRIAQNGTITHFNNENNNPTSLSHNSIWALYKDNHGAIWVGTYFGGANVFNPTIRLFTYYSPYSNKANSINFPIIGRMEEDGHGNLLIATEGGGLDVMNRKTGHFKYFKQSAKPGAIGCNNIKSIVNAGQGMFWITTHTSGVNSYNSHTDRFESLKDLPSHKAGIPGKEVNFILPFGKEFLLATPEGCFVMSYTGESVKPLLPPEIFARCPRYTTYIAIGDNNIIWIGTNDGLARYNLVSGDFTLFRNDPSDPNSICDNYINSIFVDNKSRVWVATGNGLSLFNVSTKQFENFTAKDGLPNNLVLDIIQSSYRDILFTTYDAVVIFDYSKREFLTFSQRNGLPLTGINQGGLYASSNSEIFVGGINGMVSFFEKDLIANTEYYPINITNLWVNNEKVSPTSPHSILSKNITLTDHITLQPNQKVVSIAFASMGLGNRNNRTMVYMLEGVDKQWNIADPTKRATYSNLRPGNYTFRVKYEADPENSPYQAKLDITVKPPFYLTYIAFALYFILISSIIILLNRMYLLRRRAENELILKERQHKQEDEMNQAMLMFFTDISHEFRTPLTLISGELERLVESRNIPPDSYKKVVRAYKNAQRMQNLVTELLDFRKYEHGQLATHTMYGDFKPFVYEIFLSFVEISEHRAISYSFICDAPTIMFLFDRYLMEKVLFNLLSNAFKFTPNGGTINLHLATDSDMITLRVEDSGCGIAPNNIEKVFAKYFQVDSGGANRGNGTGIGLALTKGIVEAHKGTISVESDLGRGSVFTVQIPVATGVFSDRQPIELQNPVEYISDDHTPKSATQTIPEHSKYNVLVVEDNAQMRDFLQEILSPLCNITLATNGEEGLELAAQLQPQLVLSDVMMPRMSGTEMCAKLKTNFETSHIPVVILTAKAAEDFKIEGLRTGADDYITKPFSPRLLIARIENVIKNRIAIQQRFQSEPTFSSQKIACSQLDELFLEKTKEYILKHIDDSKYDVLQLASDLNIGRTTLFAKFKGVTGQTPKDFILTIRLRYALELLKNRPELSILDVALMSGFASQQYFSTCFKKNFGTSPKRAAG